MTRSSSCWCDCENARPSTAANDEAGEPHLDGKLIVDGKTYIIRGVEWLLRADDPSDGMPGLVCTVAMEPTD
jgi:hypothetical protein